MQYNKALTLTIVHIHLSLPRTKRASMQQSEFRNPIFSEQQKYDYYRMAPTTTNNSSPESLLEEWWQPAALSTAVLVLGMVLFFCCCLLCRQQKRSRDGGGSRAGGSGWRSESAGSWPSLSFGNGGEEASTRYPSMAVRGRRRKRGGGGQRQPRYADYRAAAAGGGGGGYEGVEDSRGRAPPRDPGGGRPGRRGHRHPRYDKDKDKDYRDEEYSSGRSERFSTRKTAADDSDRSEVVVVVNSSEASAASTRASPARTDMSEGKGEEVRRRGANKTLQTSY